MSGKEPLFEMVEATTEVKRNLPLLSPKYSKRISDTTGAQMNARITRLRAAELFLEACALESTDDSKIPGLIFKHKLVVTYDGKYFVTTTVSAEKTLYCVLKGKLTGGPVCPIKNMPVDERKALEEHVKLLNKSVAQRVAIIINPVYFAPANR